MDRRRFLQTAGLGGLAGLGGGAFGAPLPKALRGSSPLASQMSPLVSHASSGLRTTGTHLGAFVRDLPRLAGSDDLQTAFGGRVWDLLSAHLPSTAADVPGFMAGHWGSPRVEQAVARLAPIHDANKWARQAATEAGFSAAHLDQLAARARQLPDLPLPKTTSPALDRALDSLVASTALRESAGALSSWRKPADINFLEGLRTAFRGLLAEPQHFATLIDGGFNSAAGLLGPAVSALDLSSLPLPSALLSPTDASRGAASLITPKHLFFLAEVPLNLAVITLDCLETAIAKDLPRIKLILEAASFVCAYSSGFAYGKPPLRTYQNDYWAIMSFGQDVVLDLFKRRRKEIGAEALDVIWGFVGGAVLVSYIVGLIVGTVGPSIPRPGLAVAKVAPSDLDPWSWAPQTIWSFLTHVLCRWAAPVANPEFWPVYMLPLWWMSVYLAGSLCEFGLWYSDYLKV